MAITTNEKDESIISFVPDRSWSVVDELVDQTLPLTSSVDNQERQSSTSLSDVNDTLDRVTQSFYEINYTVGKSASAKITSKVQTYLPSFCRPTPSKRILFNITVDLPHPVGPNFQ